MTQSRAMVATDLLDEEEVVVLEEEGTAMDRPSPPPDAIAPIMTAPGVTSAPNPSTKPVAPACDGDDAAVVKQVRTGERYAEDLPVPGSDPFPLRSLRDQRSVLFLSLCGSSLAILGFFAWAMNASIGRPVRYAPTTEAVAGVLLDRQITAVEMKQACVNLVLSMHTWAYFTVDQVARDLLPFCDPAEHKRLLNEFEANKEAWTKNWQHRAAFYVGYGYLGQQNGIHSAVVFYHYVEMTGRFGSHVQVQGDSDRAMIVHCYLGTPTEDNPVGLYLQSNERFTREQWLARGGKDVWAQLRKKPEPEAK